jgi:uncharacterized protein (DUF2249 family)
MGNTVHLSKATPNPLTYKPNEQLTTNRTLSYKWTKPKEGQDPWKIKKTAEPNSFSYETMKTKDNLMRRSSSAVFGKVLIKN